MTVIADAKETLSVAATIAKSLVLTSMKKTTAVIS